ncbi:MAG: redoxin domain-containing protein, partial [Bacteroidales bacterium]|nr:redoxin domain-containing protein [Bacteroidales bacterium]
LINQGGSEKQQADIAGVIFNYFAAAPYMGLETVAVHIADNWFLNKKLPWGDDNTYPILYTYAEFNRESLIGKSAPELKMESLNGDTISFREIPADHKILYFYEDGCAQCAKQTPAIVSMLNDYSGKSIVLFAIYTQDLRENWEKYIALNFNKIYNPNVTVCNLWDPEVESSFHKKYGVMTTPSIFLLDRDNVIIGRKLDAGALSTLIGTDDGYTANLTSFLDSITEKTGADQEAFSAIADGFYNQLGDSSSAENNHLFRQTFYLLYSYFKTGQTAAHTGTAAYIAEKYFVGMPDRWAPETIADISEALRLYKMNPLGAMATDEILYTPCGFKKHLTGGKDNYTILFFNIANCSDCANYEAQLKELTPLVKAKGGKIISVYLGWDKKGWKEKRKGTPKEWSHLADLKRKSTLYEDYDLKYVPKIYVLDKNKTIIAKDITPSTLESLLEELE